MTDLKELIEQEIDQYLEWPTADKSHVTTVSAKLFAEHMARLYADHIADARKKISRPQIREVFLRNGLKIAPGRDDLPDWVYESVFELLEMAATAVQGEPVSYQCRPAGSPHWSECSKGEHDHLKSGKPSMDGVKREARALYTTPQPAVQGEPVPVAEHQTVHQARFLSGPSSERHWEDSSPQCIDYLNDKEALRASRGEPALWEFRTLYTAPPAAPDASGLVEALEEVLDHFARTHRPYTSNEIVLCEMVESALSAHRKQGDQP